MKPYRPIRHSLLVLSLALLAACASVGQKHATPGKYVEDATITTNVKAALFQAADLATAEISVTTSHGIVELDGFIEDPAQATRADEIAKTVEGVKDVRNRLTQKR